MSVVPMNTNKSRSRSDDDDGGPRDRLREAIAARAAAAERVEKHRGAISRARQLVRAAERKAEIAGTGIGQAKSEAARLAAAAAEAGDDEIANEITNGGGVLRAARMAEVEAIDNLEAANAALKRLQAQTVEHDAGLIDAGTVVQAAVLAVLAPEIRSALARVRELDREMLPLMAWIRFAQTTGTENGPTSPLGSTHEAQLRHVLSEPLAELRAQINELTAERRRRSDERTRLAVRSLGVLRDDLANNANAPLNLPVPPS